MATAQELYRVIASINVCTDFELPKVKIARIFRHSGFFNTWGDVRQDLGSCIRYCNK